MEELERVREEKRVMEEQMLGMVGMRMAEMGVVDMAPGITDTVDNIAGVGIA